jgi:hypothetical protein
VGVVRSAEIKLALGKTGYTVEAAIPWRELGPRLPAGAVLRGDFGVTYGDDKGGDTLMRNHWANQHTGIVNDEVFELRMQPEYWGALEFRE